MTDDAPVPPSALRERREGVIQALTAHFAEDRIDAEEFERRVDRAYRALSLQELDAVSADLPSLPGPAPGEGTGRALAPPDEVRGQQVVPALMGGNERKGVWTPASRIHALAIMGGVVLDFREARFGRGVTEVNAFALMGGIEIIVPPGLRVESDGLGILGGFEGHDQRGEPSDRDQPALRVRGLAIMGGVEVVERLPGETANDTRRRLKAERKARRLGRGDG